MNFGNITTVLVQLLQQLPQAVDFVERLWAELHPHGAMQQHHDQVNQAIAQARKQPAGQAQAPGPDQGVQANPQTQQAQNQRPPTAQTGP